MGKKFCYSEWVGLWVGSKVVYSDDLDEFDLSAVKNNKTWIFEDSSGIVIPLNSGYLIAGDVGYVSGDLKPNGSVYFGNDVLSDSGSIIGDVYIIGNYYNSPVTVKEKINGDLYGGDDVISASFSATGDIVYIGWGNVEIKFQPGSKIVGGNDQVNAPRAVVGDFDILAGNGATVLLSPLAAIIAGDDTVRGERTVVGDFLYLSAASSYLEVKGSILMGDDDVTGIIFVDGDFEGIASENSQVEVGSLGVIRAGSDTVVGSAAVT